MNTHLNTLRTLRPAIKQARPKAALVCIYCYIYVTLSERTDHLQKLQYGPKALRLKQPRDSVISMQ